MVLVEPRNPLNIGAAARAMSNFGFFDLVLVNPYTVAWREARSAVGAKAVLEEARVVETVAEATADCSLVVGTASIGRRELMLPVRRLEAGAQELRARMEAGRAALLFGAEKTGLSRDHLSNCHWLLRIPTRAEHESMNLGQAVALCLWEIAREGGTAAKGPTAPAAANAEELARIEELLVEVLGESGYIPDRTARSATEKVRRLIRRMDMCHKDAVIWQGILRQIRWKLTTGGSLLP